MARGKLLAYNITGASVALPGTTVTLPASQNPPAQGPGVDVTSKVRNFDPPEFAALQAQVDASQVVYSWDGEQDFDTASLITSSPDAPHVFVYRPGATGADAPGGNVYTTEAGIIAALASYRGHGSRTVEFDSRFSTHIQPGLNKPACLITQDWDLSNCTVTAWNGAMDPSTSGFAFLGLSLTVIDFADGGFFRNMTRIDAVEMYFVNSKTNGAPPIPLPSTLLFGGGPDGAELVITGTFIAFDIIDPSATAMFEIPTVGGFGNNGLSIIAFDASFNCIFGSSFVASRFVDVARPLCDIPAEKQLNLVMSQGNIGNNVVSGVGVLGVETAGGAALAQSPMVQTAFSGTVLFNFFGTPQVPRINVDTFIDNTFGTASLFFNAIYAVDMTVAAATPLTLTLPPAAPRKGEDVQVKDAKGAAAVGNEINIVPTAGDTIDGGPGPVVINTAFGFEKFVQDGATNWIKMS